MQKTTEISNYTGTIRCMAPVSTPRDVEELVAVVHEAKQAGLSISLQGNSLSYGDSAMPTNNSVVVRLSKLNRILETNWSQSWIRVETGVTLAQILEQALPQRQILPVVPGDHQVTVGGAIANNVHGKWSWKHACFGSSVLEMKVLLASGKIIDISPVENADLFNTIIGGIGGLGIVIEAKLQLVSIPSAFVEVETISVPDLETSLRGLHDASFTHDLFLSWVDMYPRGQAAGRGFVDRGRFLKDGPDVTAEEVNISLFSSRRFLGLLPFTFVWGLLQPFWGRFFVGWLNHGLYWSGWLRSRRRAKYRMLVTDFLFIHKKVPEMRQVYYPHGYYEFQPMIPRSAGPQSVREVIEICQKHRFESLLCAIKLHAPDQFALSYSGDGFSIGIDVHAGEKSETEVRAFVNELCAYVRQKCGTMFLAKDQWIPAEYIPHFKPSLESYLAAKAKHDPGGFFVTRQTNRALLPHMKPLTDEEETHGNRFNGQLPKDET